MDLDYMWSMDHSSIVYKWENTPRNESLESRDATFIINLIKEHICNTNILIYF